MAKRDIFVHSPFFRFPKQSKKRENGIFLYVFSVLYFSAFNQKRKNRKLTSSPLKFLFFYFLKKMKKSLLYLFFVTFSIFWQIGEISSILLNTLFRF